MTTQAQRRRIRMINVAAFVLMVAWLVFVLSPFRDSGAGRRIDQVAAILGAITYLVALIRWLKIRTIPTRVGQTARKWAADIERVRSVSR